MSPSQPPPVADDVVRPIRVLIVDDDFESAEALSTFVAYAGHEVRIALSARQALGIVTEFKPDVALIDIGMPVVDGYELVAALRAMPDLRDCRFVALTGYTGKDLEQRSQSAGFGLHLTKPAAPSALLQVIAAPGSKKT